jgi:hypothetical protein
MIRGLDMGALGGGRSLEGDRPQTHSEEIHLNRLLRNDTTAQRSASDDVANGNAKSWQRVRLRSSTLHVALQIFFDGIATPRDAMLGALTIDSFWAISWVVRPMGLNARVGAMTNAFAIGSPDS